MLKKLPILIILLFTSLVKSQTYIETQKIVAPERQQTLEFGEFVAIDEDYAIVSLPIFSENGISYSGVAYMYKRNFRNVWELDQTLLPQNIESGDNFGMNVDIDSNYAVFSARQFYQENGAVYVYKRDNSNVWNETQKIDAPENALSSFGLRISISGDYLAISDYNNKVYIYEKNINDIWILVQELQNFDTDENAGELFGSTLSLKGNTLVVGDYNELIIPSLNVSGAVYVYERDNNGVWNDIQKITPAIRSIGAEFGASISINNSEDKIVVGAPLDITGQTTFGEGSAYIFYKENGVWVEHQKIIASDLESFKEFGRSVGIQNNTIVVGSPKVDYEVVPGYNIFATGAIYVFNSDQNNLWNETEKIYPSDTNQKANLGYSIDFYENTFIAGALYEAYDIDDSNPILDAGAAYFFQDANSLNIQNFQESINLKLYPNPTTGVINLKFKNSMSNGKIVLRNVLGQQIITKTFNNTNELGFNIEDASGIYFLEVYHDESKKEVFKIIKN
jgi:hypothetical protein